MQNSDIRLIVDLAESVRNAAPLQKDPRAEQLIDQLIGTQPDALYFLVQTVLLQKEALAARRPEERAPAPTVQGPADPGPAAAQRDRWSGIFGSRRSPAAEASPVAPSGGGSFLKTAAAGAAGAAGGLLIAQGISGLFTPPHEGEGPLAADPSAEDTDWGMGDAWDDV
jgi:hypothetical protein